MRSGISEKTIRVIGFIIFIGAILTSVIITILSSKNKLVETKSFTIDDLSMTTRGDFSIYQQYFDFNKDFKSIEIKSTINFEPISFFSTPKSKNIINECNSDKYRKLIRDYTEAERAYKAKNYSKSIKLLKSITKAKVENKKALGSVYFKVGEILRGQKKYKEALNNYNLSINFDFNNGNAHLRRGSCLIHLSKYSFAIRSYQNALHYNCNTNQIAYNDLGCAALKNQDIAEACNSDCLRAFHYFNQAVENDAEEMYENIYLNRGIIFMFFLEFTNAIKDFNKAIEINPTFAKAYLNRAQTHIILRNYTLARKDLERAEELSNNFTEVIEICRKDIDFLSKGA